MVHLVTESSARTHTWLGSDLQTCHIEPAIIGRQSRLSPPRRACHGRKGNLIKGPLSGRRSDRIPIPVKIRNCSGFSLNAVRSAIPVEIQFHPNDLVTRQVERRVTGGKVRVIGRVTGRHRNGTLDTDGIGAARRRGGTIMDRNGTLTRGGRGDDTPRLQPQTIVGGCIVKIVN